jgi:hypothetical protein
MQQYIWGILLGAFVLDIIKNLYSEPSVTEEYVERPPHSSHQSNYNSKNNKKNRNGMDEEDLHISEGMKIKLDNGQEAKIEYDRPSPYKSSKVGQNINLKILYWYINYIYFYLVLPDLMESTTMIFVDN